MAGERARRGWLDARLAQLQGLQHGGTQLGRGNRILENGHGTEAKRLFGPFGMQTGKQQDDGDFAMLAPYVRQELQRLAVQGIHTSQNQIDAVSLHQLDGDTVIGSSPQ